MKLVVIMDIGSVETSMASRTAGNCINYTEPYIHGRLETDVPCGSVVLSNHSQPFQMYPIDSASLRSFKSVRQPYIPFIVSENVQAIPATSQGLLASYTVFSTSASRASWITHLAAATTSEVPSLRPNTKETTTLDAIKDDAKAILDHVRWVFDPGDDPSSILA